jgi:DNA-binding NarL/FixJ family response regulator
MEVPRRLRKVVPATRILFVSGDPCPEIIGEALRIGALGFVHKPNIGSELLPAIQAVLGDIVSDSALTAN